MNLPICAECGKAIGIDETFTTDDQLNEHPQVPISHGDMHAHVDEGLARLIHACWRLGIVTTGSCQGTLPDPNAEFDFESHASLGFGVGSAEPFVSAATPEDFDDEATSFRSLGWRMRSVASEPEDLPVAWVWMPSGYRGQVNFGAWFPAVDIDERTSRLEAAG